jgi:hypothetical protein
MARVLYVIICIVVFASCTERLVCPAYQSAFIYDRDELRKKFSYFKEDSTPKILTASKTRYLIAEPTPYRKKLRSLQTVQMKKVPVSVPDSISGVKSDSVITSQLDLAARSVIDSTVVVDTPPAEATASGDDSTYVITKDKEIRILKYNMPDSLVFDAVANKYVPQKPKYYVKEVGYNMEQDNYMWYLRHSLVLPDVRIAKMQQASGKEGSGKSRGKKGKGGFFRKLFGRDKQTDIDSAELEIPRPEKEEFDYIDTTATESPADVSQSENSEKGSLFKRKKKDQAQPEGETPADTPSRKRKKDQSEDQPAEEEKKEDTGDGF